MTMLIQEGFILRWWPLLVPLVLCLHDHVTAFHCSAPLLTRFPSNQPPIRMTRTTTTTIRTSMALGDYTVELEKPLGMILEELDDNRGGVKVKELVPGGAAADSTKIVPGDVLVQVNDIDVSTLDFDAVMELLVKAPTTLLLTLGDGLGVLDMPKNVVNMLKSTEDAFFVDAVVRQAVREIRRSGQLGDLQKVEVVVGAGVSTPQSSDDNASPKRGMVRFFAIFTTDGVSTYSCNVAATGVQQSSKNDSSNGNDDNIQIVSLSCAKDEGLGMTYDLIMER